MPSHGAAQVCTGQLMAHLERVDDVLHRVHVCVELDLAGAVEQEIVVVALPELLLQPTHVLHQIPATGGMV